MTPPKNSAGAQSGSRQWLEIEEAGAPKRRVDLADGLTRLGGRGSDLDLAGWTSGELQLWSNPPKAVFLGAKDSPTADGAEFEEMLLRDGDRLAWAGATFVFRQEAGRPAAQPILEELPIEEIAPKKVAPVTPKASAVPKVKKGASALTAAPSEVGELRLSRRIRAGLMAELGILKGAELRSWQEAIMRREFRADDAAARLLATAPDVAADDPRLIERSERLMRDLMMAPMQKGAKKAGRKVKGAAKSGLAFFIVQLIVVSIFALLFLLAMVVIRVKFPDWSFDQFLENLVPWDINAK